MYCIKCGVQLADTETKCPLCETKVYHPDVAQPQGQSLYPPHKMPKTASGRPVFCGAIIMLFLIPLIITFFADMQRDGTLDWFGFVAGGITIIYLTFAFPMWFKKPNPVILVPCDFAACALYLLYVDLITGGNWFLNFALPIIGAIALIVCTVVTLLFYLRRGRLYVVGGAVMAMGALILLIEFLMDVTFAFPFIGWAFYALIPLFLIGGLLIFLAMNSVAREKIERKLFF